MRVWIFKGVLLFYEVQSDTLISKQTFIAPGLPYVSWLRCEPFEVLEKIRQKYGSTVTRRPPRSSLEVVLHKVRPGCTLYFILRMTQFQSSRFP